MFQRAIFGFRILDVAPCNGKVGIKVRYVFPDSGYRIVDKGQVIVSNDPYNRNIVIDAKVTHTTGLSGQVITLQDVIYDLGALPFEKYKLIVKSYGETVDVQTFFIPQNVPAVGNPIDNNRFFITQLYRDILGRDPDLVGLDFWTRQLDQCGANADCLRRTRVNAAAAFFASKEFQDTGSYVYRIYRLTYNIPPTFDAYQQLLPLARGTLAYGSFLDESPT